MTLLMTVVGILVFVVGLLFSIAWHEAGHLAMGKLFGVRVPQYMVGFGKTLWSKRIGETEYGIKAVPAGGYCRLIGMFPPDASGKVRTSSTSPWRAMIEDARAASYEEVGPGDENRLFYQRKPWQRVLVMLAGPVMNLVLAIVLFAIVFMGFGLRESTTTIGVVQACVVDASAPTDVCPADAEPTPAKEAGLLPGDKVVSFNGQRITTYEQLRDRIRESEGQVTLVVERGDRQLTLTPTLVENKVVALDKDGNPIAGRYVTTGFLGFGPAAANQRQSLPEAFGTMVDYTEQAFQGLLDLPKKIPALWGAAFQGEERDQDSPVGVVGAARIGGETFALDIPATDRIKFALVLVAGFNLSLFLFNMLPLLPLDGGHVVGALWESLRRNTARLLRRPDPGPFDVARLMPVAYVVAAIFIAFTALVLIADVVNPVRVT
jgi:membrane-associated protease RseP (regulator of RpoE activity)